MKQEYMSNIEYPKPQVERKNIEYANILLQDYAGKISEQTAIHLYSYQSFLEDKNWRTYAKVIEKIAEIEMKHFKLLGETISLLGVDPLFATIETNSKKQVYWNSGYVDFTTNPEAMVLRDLRSEQAAILQYEQHINIIEDRYIKRLLKRIILDEEIHIQIFESILNQLKNSQNL